MANSIYFLVITSRYCKHEIRINDLYCFNNHTGNQSGAEVPINELLKNGVNSIQVKITPIEIDPTEYDIVFSIKAVIEERDVENNTVLKEILVLSSEVLIKDIPDQIQGQFVIDDEFNPHGYLKFPVIELNPETMAAVYKFYTNVQNLMVAKDITGLIKLFEKKEIEYANAFNLNPNDRLEYIRKSLYGYITEAGADFLGLGLEFLEYQIYGYGKLICLEEKKTKRPALGIFSEINQTTNYFPIYLGIDGDEIQILK